MSSKLDHVVESIKKYQRGLYSPGHYNGTNINPAFRTRPKAVGYLVCFYGSFVVLLCALQILVESKNVSLLQGLFLLIGLVVIFYGIKMVRDNNKRK